MKDQNLGRCNAVDRDEMGRDQNDNGIFSKIQLKCKTSKKGLLLADVIDFEFFGRKQPRNCVGTIQNQLIRSSAMFT